MKLLLTFVLATFVIAPVAPFTDVTTFFAEIFPPKVAPLSTFRLEIVTLSGRPITMFGHVLRTSISDADPVITTAAVHPLIDPTAVTAPVSPLKDLTVFCVT